MKRNSSHGPDRYFFTLRLARRGDDALLRHISILRQSMRETLARKPFQINAITVLPDVIHTVWTLPKDDHDYPNRIGMWKARFSKHLPPAPHRSLQQIKRGEKGIWQRRFWEHRIRDQADFRRHCDLVHLSPMHAGLCDRPEDWPFSSYNRNRPRQAAPKFEVVDQREADDVLEDNATPLVPMDLLTGPLARLHS
ncbi:REP-associated tyrosine transposase [Sulfitobacter dubius]|uniref:REP-associated tyrosine transposase n=1 Tax=Sulfitobacter dubius TaxID=218673 RepID=UPI0008E770B3|nr:transposase [Sulfitobacter dubius]SFG50775.1 putative transposase [Sulfitobacter dubius]